MEAKEFKKQLAFGISQISEGLSSDLEPMKKSVLIKMTDLVYKRISEAGLTTDFKPYEKAFNSILTGKIEFYKLNTINLMAVFQREVAKLTAIQTPEAWLR